MKVFNKIFQNKEKKKVVHNFFYLFIVQFTNFILPLIVLPYLIRVLGVGHIGEINLAASLVVYCVVFLNYGYNFLGSKFISQHLEDKELISQYYVNAMTLRFFLLIISFFILSFVVLLVDKFSYIWVLCLLSYGVAISSFLFPIWVFQGLQEMKYITFINLSTKVIAAIAIFLLIKNENDYILVPAINSISGIVTGLFGIKILNKYFNIKFKSMLKMSSITTHLKSGKDVFFQQLYVSLYAPICVLLIGLFLTVTDVGVFTIAEKIVAIPIMIVAIGVQAYYPYAVRVYKHSQVTYYKQIKLISFLIFMMGLIITFFMIYFSPKIYFLFAGMEGNDGISMIRILAIGICFASFGQFYTQVFVTINKTHILNKISLITMMATLLLLPLVITQYGLYGAGVFIVSRQAIVILSCYKFIFKGKYEQIS